MLSKNRKCGVKSRDHKYYICSMKRHPIGVNAIKSSLFKLFNYWIAAHFYDFFM